MGFMHAIHATDNLDATADFYKEVFGLSSPIRPFAGDGPRVLTDSPEANLRVSMLPIPGRGSTSSSPNSPTLPRAHRASSRRSPIPARRT